MCHSCRDINSTVFNSSTPDSGAWLWNTTTGAQVGMSVMMNIVVPLYGDEGNNDTETLTFDTLMIQEPCGNSSCRWPWAFRCGLYPCVKTYAANISRFVLDENITATYPLDYNSEWGDFLLATVNTLRNGIWTDCIPSDKPTADNTVAFPFSTTGNLPDNVTQQYYPEDCVWSFERVAINALTPYLAGMFFHGSIVSNYAMWFNAQGDPWLLNLGHNGTANLSTADSFMEGLSNTITATMRQRGPNGTSVYAHGITYASQTCVGARWAWLTLPATLLLSAIVFLAITIVQTTMQVWHVPWKSSSLALVMHSFDDDTRRRLGSVDQLDEMSEAARSMRAQLVPTDNGWRLVERGVPPTCSSTVDRH